MRIFIILAALVFAAIGFLGYRKKFPEPVSKQEVIPDIEPKVLLPDPPAPVALGHDPLGHDPLETIDEVRRFFSKGHDKFPIVETIAYKSRTPWIEGRPAWLADYAAHFQTSRHFIARSLNGKVDYETQKVAPGDKFNVFKEGAAVEFYLLVDLSRCVMDFYYLDLDRDERVFVKRYKVGVGRKDPRSPSGSLTPTGKYRLGDKIAVYKPGMQHYYQNQKVDMIRVYGTRWLPFSEEISDCTDGARGYGIHGLPWHPIDGTDNLIETGELGTYASDGCIRLVKEDMEELFAIVITKPTTVEIVPQRAKAHLPMGKERIFEDDGHAAR